MTTKLVCRLLDVTGRLLGWTDHHAAARGDGYLRATLPVVLDVDEDGEAVQVSVHWADVNVEVRVSIPPVTVTRGQALTIFQPQAAMLSVGVPPLTRLPPVTTKRAVDVSVPVGQLGASGIQA